MSTAGDDLGFTPEQGDALSNAYFALANAIDTAVDRARQIGEALTASSTKQARDEGEHHAG